MKNFAEKVYTAVYETNEKGEMKQNVRNAFKSEMMKAFKEFLTENGFSVENVNDGVAVSFANEIEGSVVVIFDGTVKSLSYDLVSEVDAYNEKVSEKERKEKEKAEKKEKNVKEKATK